MAQRTSSAAEVERLIADLHSNEPVRRAAAVARLRVIGSRAITRLSAVVASDAPAAARALALSALEDIDDPRAVDPALAALQVPDVTVVVAALGVLRRWVTREAGTRVLDAIAALATARDGDPLVRATAVDALSDLPAHLVEPVLQQARTAAGAAPSLADPAAVREWIASHGDTAALSRLHELVKATRDREQAEESASRRVEWLNARGAAHAALARRGSRVALYDLREAFDAARASLPPAFLEAIGAIGDASCLQPLARAWAASPRDLRWRAELSAAAATIMRRKRLTARSAEVKRIRERWTGFL